MGEPTTGERRVVHVVVFVREPAAVLMLRRPEARAAGWQGVTGRVEPADALGPPSALLRGAPATPEVTTLVRAVVREIEEETGLGPPLEVLDLGLERGFDGYDAVRYHQRSFAARYAKAAMPRATPEHEEARWVPPAEARALARWESDRAAIDVLARILGW